MHLAELNIGRLRHPLGDRRAAGFFNNLDRVNEIGERMPGFDWRFTDPSGKATLAQFGNDQMIVPNLSVWESVEALEKFVWQTVHADFYKMRAHWFEKSTKPNFVMWWVAEGHRPDLQEAIERLAHYTDHGPSDFAFGWAEARKAMLQHESQYS